MSNSTAITSVLSPASLIRPMVSLIEVAFMSASAKPRHPALAYATATALPIPDPWFKSAFVSMTAACNVMSERSYLPLSPNQYHQETF